MTKTESKKYKKITFYVFLIRLQLQRRGMKIAIFINKKIYCGIWAGRFVNILFYDVIYILFIIITVV